jgi:hypothetical protein
LIQVSTLIQKNEQITIKKEIEYSVQNTLFFHPDYNYKLSDLKNKEGKIEISVEDILSFSYRLIID